MALRERVLAEPDAQGRSAPGPERLRALTSERGVDYATALLDAALRATHVETIRKLEAAPLPHALQTDLRLLVVPTLFFEEHPEIGGDGALVLEAARRLGVAAERAPVASLGSVEANATRLLEWLENGSSERVWAVTLSKGGLELKRALQRAGAGRTLGRLRGWVNIGGVLGGSAIVDRMLRSAWRRLAVGAFLRARGGSLDAIAQMGRRHPVARQPLEGTGHVEVLNVVALPLASHVTQRAARGFRQLQAAGPNDGFVSFWDAIVPGAPVYPVWGCDHYLRTPHLSALLYRLVAWIVERDLARG